MRSGAWLLGLVLTVFVSDVASAQPKRSAAGAARKGRSGSRAPAHPAEAPEPSGSAAPAAGDTNPYGSGSDAEAAAPAAPSATAPAPAGEAPAGNDAKLDEAPPPRTEKAEGPKLSPLNPEAPEMPASAPKAAPVDLDKLMADIATLRARVAALTTSLFSSKLRIYVHTEGDDARIQGFAVTLDDGAVFRAEPGFVAEDQKVVYEHAVAPGSHVVGIEIERTDARGASFRTWQVSRFAIQVPERKVLEAIVDIEDDSDMAEDFPDDQDGKYDLDVRLRAKVAE